jgi:hypothetical protein
MDKVKKTAILSVIHHSQNSLESSAMAATYCVVSTTAVFPIYYVIIYSVKSADR